MELHTLSVNGGYSQKDVTEVAKVFTGWTIEQPKNGGAFRFDPRMHEPGEKIVLGHKIKENGEKEGIEVLRMLARHPKTAHFISQKLAVRFVSDDPPSTLVDRMTQTFLKKHGDIREVLARPHRGLRTQRRGDVGASFPAATAKRIYAGRDCRADDGQCREIF